MYTRHVLYLYFLQVYLQDDLDQEDIEEISYSIFDTKRSKQEQELQDNKRKKKIFDNVVDYNDQLIICENCLRPIIVWDITRIPTPKYCKTCLKYAML
jgi:hypothetical protein